VTQADLGWRIGLLGASGFDCPASWPDLMFLVQTDLRVRPFHIV
jgi:hypothetical protein